MNPKPKALGVTILNGLGFRSMKVDNCVLTLSFDGQSSPQAYTEESIDATSANSEV